MYSESDDDDDDDIVFNTYASAAQCFLNSEIFNGCFQPPLPFPFTTTDFPPLAAAALPDYLMHYAPFGADIDQVDGNARRAEGADK